MEKWNLTSLDLHSPFTSKPLRLHKNKNKNAPIVTYIPYEVLATKIKDEEAILNAVTTNVFWELSPCFS